MTSTRARSAPDVPASETPTRLTVTDRVARGRAARSAAPRSAHREFGPSTDRFDPSPCSRAQDASRVTELVPIRYGRMPDPPFTFFRRAAPEMAADLAGTPVSGDVVQLCGDAHLSNFGFFASPERRLVFDLNDFDETLPGPWDGTSNGSRPVSRSPAATAGSTTVIGGRRPGGRSRLSPRAMRRFAGDDHPRGVVRPGPMSTNSEPDILEDFAAGAALRKRVDRTSREGPDAWTAPRRARPSFTSLVDGMPALHTYPPVVMPLARLLPDTAERTDLENSCPGCSAATTTLSRRTDVHLLDQYRPVRHGPEGRRRRQRRHPVLDDPSPRPGRPRRAGAAGEGSRPLRARGAPRTPPERQPRASGSSSVSD